MRPLAVALSILLAVSVETRRAGAAPAAPAELTALPVVDGDSDIGFGGGYIMSYAAVPPGFEPYRWRLESAGVMTLKSADGGGLRVPYLDDYLWLHLPHVLEGKLEFRVRLSYTRETNLKFTGLGNASQLVAGLRSSDPYYEHARERPALRWSALYHLTRDVDLSWGAAFSYNSVTVPPATRLAETMRSGSAYERALLGRAADHASAQFSLGAAYDTRDSYVNTRRGTQLLLRVDLAPGGARAIPYDYARVTSAASAFLPLRPERLVLAGHLAADLLFGDAPFYELPRFDDVYFGGAFGVRGVPGQRYWGKAKLLSNLELRSELFSFSFWSKRNIFGLTAFFDAGRVWAGYRSHPELDGTGLGLKVGTGAGVRLVAGGSFVLRLDVAYSPDANPYGIYLTSGHTF